MSFKDIISALGKSRFGPLLGFIVLANVFLLLGAALNQVFTGPEEVASSTECTAIVQSAAPADSQIPASVPNSIPDSPDSSAAC